MITEFNFKEELARLMNTQKIVALHINEYYSAIGIIKSVEHDFIILEETQNNTPNKHIAIPINKIVYSRQL